MAERPQLARRADYVAFVPISTRWHDNDVYGHINNVIYYSYFDTAVNQLLVEAGVLDPATNEIVGLVVETRCSYFAPIAFPDPIEVGVKVVHLGTSSVRYDVGIFRGDAEITSARGDFTHVYVERASGTSTPIPAAVRAVLEQLKGSQT